MMRIGLALCAVAALVTAASAQPAEEREALMKSLGRAVGSVAPIAKGETEFDQQAVMAALQELDAQAQKLDVAALFPEGSMGDTEASPRIWEDMAGFQKAVDDFKADTAAAVAANPADLEAFRTQFAAVTQNCGTCHESYRVKKD